MPIGQIKDLASHGTTYKPARHRAKLAVNCAMTLGDFLFETKAYQQAKGFIATSATPAPVATARVRPNAFEQYLVDGGERSTVIASALR